MIFLLVLSHLVTDQLLAWVHSIHISINMLSLRPLFRIRVQHSHSTFTRTQFRTQTESFLYLEYEKFCFVSEQGTEKKNRICVEFPTIFQCVNVVAPRVTRSTPRCAPPFHHTRALVYHLGYCEYDSMSGATCQRVQFEYNCNWSTNPFGQNE